MTVSSATVLIDHILFLCPLDQGTLGVAGISIPVSPSSPAHSPHVSSPDDR